MIIFRIFYLADYSNDRSFFFLFSLQDVQTKNAHHNFPGPKRLSSDQTLHLLSEKEAQACIYPGITFA